MHYNEYLCNLIRASKIDTIDMLNADDLETVVRRAAKKLPPNCFGTPREVYRQRLRQVHKKCILFLQKMLRGYVRTSSFIVTE